METSVAVIRGRLMMRGESVASWAAARGYQPRTVRQVIRRWAGRSGVPQGVLTSRILADLTRDLDITIVPGIAPGREAA